MSEPPWETTTITAAGPEAIREVDWTSEPSTHQPAQNSRQYNTGINCCKRLPQDDDIHQPKDQTNPEQGNGDQRAG